MRIVLIVTPGHRRGYADSAALDSASRGEKPAVIRVRQASNYVSEAIRWLQLVDAVAVYDDLPMTANMRQVIDLALVDRLPVEYRRLPGDRISVINRVELCD